MSEDNDGDNDNSDDDGDNDNNTDWRQVTKGRRAVTQTDERRVTPVRNQFQGSIGNTDIPEDENDDNTDTGSFGSTESFDTMTDITNDYGSLIEIIRLVNAEQAKVYNEKKKNYADIIKIPRSPRQRPLEATMLWNSWRLFLVSRHRRKLHLQDRGNNTIYSPDYAQRTTIANRTPKIRINQRIQTIHNRPTKV